MTLLHLVPGGSAAAESRADTYGVPVYVRASGKASADATRTYAAIANDVAFRTSARVSLRIAAGDPADCFVEAAEELDADLLVIGHTRRGRLSGILLDEAHDRVVSRASVTVMLVPAGATLGEERVVLACRRSAAPRNAAEFAGRLAGRLRAPVLVTQVRPSRGRERVTAWEMYDAARRDSDAMAAASAEDIDVEYAEYDGRVGQTLAAVPERVDAAFMVIGERRRTSRQRVLRPSVARRVARRARRPIIVVPDTDKAVRPAHASERFTPRDASLHDRAA